MHGDADQPEQRGSQRLGPRRQEGAADRFLQDASGSAIQQDQPDRSESDDGDPHSSPAVSIASRIALPRVPPVAKGRPCAVSMGTPNSQAVRKSRR